MAEITYGDWRDDVIALGIPLHMAESKYASPMCPKHGWLGMRKKKINIWQCDECGFKVILDESEYRAWRERNANNLFSAVPPAQGSHCLRYIEPKNPGQMDGCAECIRSFRRCLVSSALTERPMMAIKAHQGE